MVDWGVDWGGIDRHIQYLIKASILTWCLCTFTQMITTLINFSNLKRMLIFSSFSMIMELWAMWPLVLHKEISLTKLTCTSCRHIASFNNVVIIVLTSCMHLFKFSNVIWNLKLCCEYDSICNLVYIGWALVRSIETGSINCCWLMSEVIERVCLSTQSEQVKGGVGDA